MGSTAAFGRVLRKAIVAVAIIAAALAGSINTVNAGGNTIRIGVLNDMSSVYADFQGPGSVISAQMAMEDFGGRTAGKPVEVIAGDHQNKPDVGKAIAQKWFDEDGVDVIVDVPNSAVALAVSYLTRERNKVFLGSGAGTSELTGKRCSPNTVHWTYDTWAQGHGVARALTERGLKRWFFVTSDYAFGHDLEANASAEITRNGGTVLGAVRHPLGTADFSSFLLQAQSSGADVVAFANAGGDFTTSVKQAAEFGLPQKQKLTGLILNTNNVPALGLAVAQGLFALNSFYWDMDDGKRAWARRWAERHPQHNMPNDMQAGVYAAVLHYLKAIDRLRSAADGKAAVAQMKAMPTDDPLFGKGVIREDGRKLHPMYLFQVKTPAESSGKWDVYKLVSTVPADQAFRPLSEGNCPLIKEAAAK
jgi:branched-chain amino acid transport system substrate-binding protein